MDLTGLRLDAAAHTAGPEPRAAGWPGTERSALVQLEPGDSPAAALPPSPPGRQARHELETAACLGVAGGAAELRYPRPAAVGDLDPDHPGHGPDRPDGGAELHPGATHDGEWRSNTCQRRLNFRRRRHIRLVSAGAGRD